MAVVQDIHIIVVLFLPAKVKQYVDGLKNS